MCKLSSEKYTQIAETLIIRTAIQENVSPYKKLYYHVLTQYFLLVTLSVVALTYYTHLGIYSSLLVQCAVCTRKTGRPCTLTQGKSCAHYICIGGMPQQLDQGCTLTAVCRLHIYGWCQSSHLECDLPAETLRNSHSISGWVCLDTIYDWKASVFTWLSVAPVFAESSFTFDCSPGHREMFNTMLHLDMSSSCVFFFAFDPCWNSHGV